MSSPFSQLRDSGREYLEGLVDYLESFYDRTQPLSTLDKVYGKLADFDARFEAGEVPGWADRGEGPSADETAAVIDLAAFASVEEVETLGEVPFSGYTFVMHIL